MGRPPCPSVFVTMIPSCRVRTAHDALVIKRRRDVAAEDLKRAEPALLVAAALDRSWGDPAVRRALMEMFEWSSGFPRARAARPDEEECEERA
jgi:hypothetical protein